MLSCFDTL